MTDVAMVKQSREGLAAAIEGADWARADRELQYFAGVWQRARVRGGDSVELASAMDELRIGVVTDHDVDPEPGPAQIAWMLAGVCSFLGQAVVPSELTGRDVGSRILDALAADGELLATKDLAKRIGRSVNATARLLPGLRDQGFTTETPAGRSTLNGITDSGRARIAQIKAEDLRRAELAKAWPTSVVKQQDAQQPGPTPMEASDLLSVVTPNDVRSFRDGLRKRA